MKISNSLSAAVLSLAMLLGFSWGLRAPEPATFVSTPAQAASKVSLLERERLKIQALSDHLSAKYKKELPLVTRIVEAAFLEATHRQVSPLLVLAIIEQESSFRPGSYSGYGAMGLMQVVPRMHPEKLKNPANPVELLNPVHNVKVGTQVLAEYLRMKKGDVPAALRKYSGNATAYYEKVARFKAQLNRVVVRAQDSQEA